MGNLSFTARKRSRPSPVECLSPQHRATGAPSQAPAGSRRPGGPLVPGGAGLPAPPAQGRRWTRARESYPLGTYPAVRNALQVGAVPYIKDCAAPRDMVGHIIDQRP
ncbi:hypothetical protein Acsp04_42760 [Actinomadura sp. NBRC 104425]|nr:hypothetical protein Acsp04_42760 [Actinomadura sp. NBRC 104425]